MKKYFLLLFVALCCLLSGCGSQATVKVLETCKVIGSVIIETSISADDQYFTITFENGLFYCEDRTNDSVVYTIKVPADNEFNMFAILNSIVFEMTEDDFNELEANNECQFFKAYRAYWKVTKSIEGETIKYVLK